MQNGANETLTDETLADDIHNMAAMLNNWVDKIHINGGDSMATATEPPRYNRPPVCLCDGCGADIVVGEKFYKIDRGNYCDLCVTVAIAEEEEE